MCANVPHSLFPHYWVELDSTGVLLRSRTHSMLLHGINTDDCRKQGNRRIQSRLYGCFSVIEITFQFVVSGSHFNMNFLLLCIQSSVCVTCVFLVKKMGIISFRDFDMKDAKMWFPISVMLVSVIYTGSKSLVSVVVSRVLLRMTGV